MADAMSRVPLAAKVDVFYAKIGCDQELCTAWSLQNGTVIANAMHN
jgi:hypothetical protein